MIRSRKRRFFIFDTVEVSWNNLAENFDEVVNKPLGYPKFFDIKKKVFVGSSFPIPGNYKGSDNAHITYNDESINFGRPGEYYIRTSLGSFKVLILDNSKTKDEQALSIGSFVSRNSLNCFADAYKIRPYPQSYNYHRPDKLLKKFFSSDQPIALHCGGMADFLNHILWKKGYRVQRVHIGTHVVSHVFFPDKKKWVMIDADDGFIIQDDKEKYLSIEEIINTDSELHLVDIGGKKALKDGYSLYIYTPEFTWTVDKMEDRPLLEEERYIGIMKNPIDGRVIINEYDKHFSWINRTDRIIKKE